MKHLNPFNNREFYREIEFICEEDIQMIDISEKATRLVDKYLEYKICLDGFTTKKYLSVNNMAAQLQKRQLQKHIIELKDEWFLVNFNNLERYFICDQLQGLEELIKDFKEKF